MSHAVTLATVLAVAVVSLTATPVAAASDDDPDAQFRRAQQLAREGRRDEARAACAAILDARPGYHDARVLLGRLLAWEDDFDAARRELTRVLDARPDYADARDALIDVELWSHRPEAALDAADDGLALEPDRAGWHAARARALHRLGREEEAAEAAERALALDPDREDAKRLLRRLADTLLGERVLVEYEIENFDDIDTWHLLVVQYRRPFEFGSMLFRVNLAERFDDTGAQLEIDAYPRLSPGTWLYLNAGVSDSDVFPDARFGAEVYRSLPRRFELSAGLRYLDFESTDVWIFTGSVARYQGDWWVRLRPSWVSDDDGDSLSGEIQARRYLGGRYEYWGVTVGGGVGDKLDIVTLQEDSLDSFRARVDLRKKISRRVLLRLGGGWREQEFRAGSTRESWFAQVGLERFF